MVSDRLSLRYTSHDGVPVDAGPVVGAGLDSSNASAAPLHEVMPLSCFARDSADSVVGGIIGRTWGGCCEVQQLWVHPEFRRKGIGRRLVEDFHQIAEDRGCRTFYLETFSFQAPSFYASLGYETKLELKGFSEGVVKYVMVRECR